LARLNELLTSFKDQALPADQGKTRGSVSRRDGFMYQGIWKNDTLVWLLLFLSEKNCTSLVQLISLLPILF